MNSSTPPLTRPFSLSPFPFTDFLPFFHSGGSVREVPNNKEVFVCIILALHARTQWRGPDCRTDWRLPMNTGGAGRASLGPIRAERRYISMFEWSGMAWGLEGLSRSPKTHDHGLLCVGCSSPVRRLAYVWQMTPGPLSRPVLSLPSAPKHTFFLTDIIACYLRHKFFGALFWTKYKHDHLVMFKRSVFFFLLLLTVASKVNRNMCLGHRCRQWT